VTEVREGDELELDVERVAHGGVFVAHAGGRVVFVPDALPGERVRVRIADASHERFVRAEALAVLDASPDRRPHVWSAAAIDRPPAARAGGAEFGHIAPGRQRALKREVLADALLRTGRLPQEALAAVAGDPAGPEVQALPGPPDGTRSRTRIRLHVDADGRAGPYAARSRTVVAVADLPLAADGLEAVARLGGRWAGTSGVDLVAPSAGEPFALADGDGHPPIAEVVGDRRFALEARGFWQVHPAAAATLAAAVRRAVRPDLLDPAAPNLDLYGGVGLLAAALADVAGRGARITTVETDRRASDHAAANLADLPRARAVAARVDRYLRTEHRGRGAERATVVLDPPRSGAGRAVIDLVAARSPAQLVYVACDPVALGRDLGLLRGHGYELASLEAFDLFPNTHHLEAVAAFRR
jgi:tRNA/tmRNA/rRNA uracil-C5-methylase (TrmA/RlmC/RlmD family)